MRGFYVFLSDHYKIAPEDLSDLLRSELVNLVSAMDRFIHEFVRIGIINSYTNKTPQTDKCKSISIKFSTLNKVIECQSRKTPPTCNYPFPESTPNANQKFLEKKIDLIVSRRNQIVHEADYDISINSKQTININWLDDTILFVKEFVYSIYENISGDSSYERL